MTKKEYKPRQYELQPKVCPECLSVMNAFAKVCPRCYHKFKGFSWEYQIKEANKGDK